LPLSTPSLLSVAVDLLVTNISYNWNHILCNCLLLCHWLLWLSIMFLRFSHVVASVSISFLWPNNILL
jgi:hypothetical protein